MAKTKITLTPAFERLVQADVSFSAVYRSFGTKMTEFADRVKADPTLSDEGRRQSIAAERAKVLNISDQIDQARALANKVIAEGDGARPKADLHDLATGLQIDRKWRQVESLLASGRSLAGVVRDADADTLHAIEEYGPTWQRSKTLSVLGLGGIVEDADSASRFVELINQIVSDRWAQILPDDARSAVLLVKPAELYLRKIDGWEQMFAHLSRGGDAMADVISLSLIQREIDRLLSGTDTAYSELHQMVSDAMERGGIKPDQFVS